MIIFAAVYTINIGTNLFQPLAKIVNVVLNITLIKIKMEELVKFVQDEFIAKKEFPTFGAGDTITVYYEIREGEKTRTQFFRGVVIQVKGTGTSQTFTIRKMSGTIGVERIFPINLPALQKIEINKKGDVRRKRIYYFRGLTGKKARIKEKRM
jgi:large subunit ribosomal protein L19